MRPGSWTVGLYKLVLVQVYFRFPDADLRPYQCGVDNDGEVEAPLGFSSISVQTKRRGGSM